MFYKAITAAAFMTSAQVLNALMHEMQASSIRINSALHVVRTNNATDIYSRCVTHMWCESHIYKARMLNTRRISGLAVSHI
jgi:hypothetical protein